MPKPYFFDKQKKIQEIIRVDHAGEFGAKRIYQGQIDFIKTIKDKLVIKDMLEQELEHLEYFENEIKNSRSNPTILLPLWNVGGYCLGALSGLIGTKVAMLVTESIEEAIVNHYQEQINQLEKIDGDSLLLAKIKKFKQDEANHIQIANINDSKKVVFYNFLNKSMKTICNIAIFLSKRV